MGSDCVNNHERGGYPRKTIREDSRVGVPFVDSLRCDVAIVGCGPTGVVLANLLGALGLSVVALERESEVYPVPRATHIDEETLRNFQATGLIDALLPHTTPFGAVEIVDEKGTVLWTDRVGDPNTPHGYSGSRFFDQPAFERILRDGLARYPSVRLHLGVDVVSVDARGDGVTVRARRPDTDALLTVRAAWVVGCDGGRSVTRDAVGVEMESVAPKRPWLIVDTLLRDAADAALLPDCFRYVFSPDRLTVYAHGIGVNRRWEFQLGEDEEMPSRDEVLRWVSSFVDPARLEVTRIVPYAHTSLLAKAWRVGRVFLAGDAAHMMPPSAGQGMCSGIRDAVNLAWKLHEYSRGAARPELLDSYMRERRPHVREILEGTLFIGKRLQGDTPFQRWRRRQMFKLITALPPLRAMVRRQGVRRPHLHEGFLDGDAPLAGRSLPQVDVLFEGTVRRLDDVLGYRFALVSLPAALSAPDVEWAAARSVGLWRVGVDFTERDGGRLERWMRERGIDFALVRPDRCIFSAGAARALPRARAAFDAMGSAE
jgi:3-(3-hydroxy-phenyl)propionate hydroxylase